MVSTEKTERDGRIIPPECLAVAGPDGRVGIFDPTTGRSYY